jgi:hypothetical protein
MQRVGPMTLREFLGLDYLLVCEDCAGPGLCEGPFEVKVGCRLGGLHRMQLVVEREVWELVEEGTRMVEKVLMAGLES